MKKKSMKNGKTTLENNKTKIAATNNEELHVFSLRLPRSVTHALDGYCDENAKERTKLIRKLIVDFLQRENVLPN